MSNSISTGLPRPFQIRSLKHEQEHPEDTNLESVCTRDLVQRLQKEREREREKERKPQEICICDVCENQRRSDDYADYLGDKDNYCL